VIRVDCSVIVWAEDDESADQVLRQIKGAVYGPSSVQVVELGRALEDDES